ncbi:hypothetical protein EXIGLDRAFT_262890 [Exidia glandulosa HHB12029]|uniref:Uncharacterized protein n=1 Tax=Exidia glandulosa HHB12029 TaxID=1314781 RepID=A0A165ZRK3_EXIGL|nr:hypothetical protein EXIGLDRAFT_262890 [Exidia glandulosa HHB12029]
MARTVRQGANSAWVVSHFSPDRGEEETKHGWYPDGSCAGVWRSAETRSAHGTRTCVVFAIRHSSRLVKVVDIPTGDEFIVGSPCKVPGRVNALSPEESGAKTTGL